MKTLLLLASLLLLLALLPVSQATAQTKTITIGNFKYVGTGLTQTGVVVSAYEVLLDTTNVTSSPITFSNVIFIVKGTSLSSQQSGFPTITTTYGCGQPGITEQCDLLANGGPSSAGYKLAPCATYKSAKQVFTQTCISLALQLVSLTGKNFSFVLVDGEQFCAYGINNVFLLAKPDQVALDPQCGSDGFCKGASVPVVLHAAPAKSCS